MKWIRLWVTNTVFGSTFKELDAESRAVWFSLLPLSAVNPPYGEVSICAGMGYTVEQLATLINLDAKLIGRAIEKLKAVGKIEVLKHNVIRICNWEHYQTEYERQKPYRDGYSKRLQTTVTGRIEEEEEEEEDKKKKRTKEPPAFVAWWNKYPEHTLKSHALSRWILEVTTPEDEKLVMVALDKYLQTRSVQRGFIMRPSNWLKSWRDWLEDSTPAKRTHKNTPEVEAMLARGRAARRADGGLGTRGGGDGDGGTVPAAGGDETT